MDKPAEAIWRVYTQRCTRGDKKWCCVTELYVPHMGVLTFVHVAFNSRIRAWIFKHAGWYQMPADLNWHEINRGL